MAKYKVVRNFFKGEKDKAHVHVMKGTDKKPAHVELSDEYVEANPHLLEDGVIEHAGKGGEAKEEPKEEKAGKVEKNEDKKFEKKKPTAVRNAWKPSASKGGPGRPRKKAKGKL